MSIIKFTEHDHKYTHYTGKTYTSTTTLIGYYKQPFDSEYWSLYKALERYITERKGKDYFITTKSKVGYENIIPTQLPLVANIELLEQYQDQILDEWDEKKRIACEKGTAFHKEMEFSTNSAEHDLETNLPVQIVKRDLATLQTGVYAELVVWHELYELAGQADKVVIDGIYVDIDDYKTSKFIDKKSFKHHITGHRMLLEPISHLMDCNYLHYTLQLSIYAYMLECFGFTVRRLRIYYQPKDVWIEVQYLREEVITILNHHKETRLLSAHEF